MELCFYHDTGFFAACIRWWTGSPYAHVEFRFSDGRHWGAVDGIGSSWLSPRNPDLTLPITCQPWEETLLAGWCENETGCPYDWKGVFFAQLLNRARSAKNAWFCSEACVAGLVYMRALPDWLEPCTVSPARLLHIWQRVRASASWMTP